MANGKGRDRRREAQWRRIVREHTRSGLGLRQFCRKSKLHESAFYFWRRELGRRDLERREAEQEQRKGPSKAAFVPVRLATEVPREPAGFIEIVLSGGRRLHVTAPVDRQALADVLAVLEARPC
jgi:transposase-like protein